MRSTCCLVNSMVVCWFDWPNDCEVLLIVLDLAEIDAVWECFMPKDMLICGFINVLFIFVWVSEEFDCLGRSGDKGKM